MTEGESEGSGVERGERMTGSVRSQGGRVRESCRCRAGSARRQHMNRQQQGRGIRPERILVLKGSVNDAKTLSFEEAAWDAGASGRIDKKVFIFPRLMKSNEAGWGTIPRRAVARASAGLLPQLFSMKSASTVTKNVVRDRRGNLGRQVFIIPSLRKRFASLDPCIPAQQPGRPYRTRQAKQNTCGFPAPIRMRRARAFTHHHWV
jgi:hypothetical protein